MLDHYLKSKEGIVKDATYQSYCTMAGHVKKHAGRSQAATIGISPRARLVIGEYVTSRRHEGAGRCIAKELSLLRSALKSVGYPSELPTPREITRLPTRTPAAPRADEVRDVLFAAGDQTRLAILLAIFGGLRHAETFRVRREFIQPANRVDAKSEQSGSESSGEGSSIPGGDQTQLGQAEYHGKQRGLILCIPGSIRKYHRPNHLPVVECLRRELDNRVDGGGFHDRGDEPELLIDTSPSVVQAELKFITKDLPSTWYGLQPARRFLCMAAEDAGHSPDAIALVTGHTRTSMASRYSGSYGRLDLKRKILEDVEEALLYG